MINPVKNRYDFILFFDVQDGNPNGDPDAGNLPRTDAETGKGLVTDVCLKRKIRNYVQFEKKHQRPYDIFVKESGITQEITILNKVIREGYEELGIDLSTEEDLDGNKRRTENIAQGSEKKKGREFMCSNFFDVRTFGAVMSTGPNAGQVRGPVQMTFARSVDPIVSLEHSLTVVAARSENKEPESQVGIQGRKYTVPYGLYRAHGFVSANFADQTGFGEDDLKLFWDALYGMFRDDSSASHGLMAVRKIIIFKHDSALGNAPAHKLFEIIPNPTLKDASKPPREFSDYQDIVIPSDDQLPANITLSVIE
jgi:CRISPR-associated protein Csd2